MLVLERKPGERIMIDGGITVMVCSVQGEKVKLGVTAPKDTNIDREEVYVEKSKRTDD